MIYPFIWGKSYTPFKCELNHHNSTRQSVAYFCPHCGEVWARLVSDRSKADWIAYHVGCDRCEQPNLFAPAGSLLLSFDTLLESSLPLALLRREVLLLRSL